MTTGALSQPRPAQPHAEPQHGEPRPAGPLAETGRLLVALLFAVSALGINTFYTLRHPEMFDDLARLAVLPPYRGLLASVIRPLAMPFTLLLIAFELAVTVFVLARGKAVKFGLLAAIIFELALIPGVAVYGLVNLVLAAGQALLLRRTYPRSLLDHLRGKG